MAAGGWLDVDKATLQHKRFPNVFGVGDINGKVVLISDGCLECGTCRIICAETGEVDTTYPEGSLGAYNELNRVTEPLPDEPDEISKLFTPLNFKTK